jgi:ribosomal protein S18 acetylase RimI-like enzyme
MNAALLASIEDASLNASAPPQQLWLDGWLVRFCPGKAKRARSINAVAPGRLPFAEKLRRAEAAFGEAGLPVVARVTPFSQPEGFDAAFAALGYQSFDTTHVMVADIAPQQPARALAAGLSLERADAASYAEIVGIFRGSPAAQRSAHAQRMSLSPVPYQGFLLKRAGELLACGQFAREGEFVGLYDVFTAPQARGQGLAKTLCAQLLAEASRQGARTAYLQVTAGNASAIAVYRALGFAPGYDYHYRALDPAKAL